MRKSISTGVVLAIAATAVLTGVANAAGRTGGQVDPVSAVVLALPSKAGDTAERSPWPSVPVSGADVQVSPAAAAN